MLEDYHTREMAIPGGLGSGKTEFGNYWHHTRVILNPKSRSWYIAPKYDLLRYVNMARYIAMLKALGYRENKHFKVNLSDRWIEYYFGHVVFFKSANTAEQFIADEISHFTSDETGSSDKKAITYAQTRVRCPAAKVLQSLCLGTPQGLNHFAKRYSGPEFVQDGPFKRTKDKLVLHFHTYWNKHLPKSYIGDLLSNLGHDPQLIKAWIFGQFVPLFEKGVYNFNQEKHTAVIDPYFDNPMLYLGWDFNVGQVAWCAEQGIKGGYHVVRESPKGCQGTDEACDAFIEEFPKHKWQNHEIVVDGDASGWAGDTRGLLTDYDIIREKLRPIYPNLRIIAADHNPSVRVRILVTNRLLGKQLFSISTKCPNTIEAMNVTAYDGKGGIAKPEKDTWTHWSDAATYPLVNLEPPVRLHVRGGNW